MYFQLHYYLIQTNKKNIRNKSLLIRKITRKWRAFYYKNDFVMFFCKNICLFFFLFIYWFTLLLFYKYLAKIVFFIIFNFILHLLIFFKICMYIVFFYWKSYSQFIAFFLFNISYYRKSVAFYIFVMFYMIYSIIINIFLKYI